MSAARSVGLSLPHFSVYVSPYECERMDVFGGTGKLGGDGLARCEKGTLQAPDPGRNRTSGGKQQL